MMSPLRLASASVIHQNYHSWPDGLKNGHRQAFGEGHLLCGMTQVSVALTKQLNVGVHSILLQMLMVIINIK